MTGRVSTARVARPGHPFFFAAAFLAAVVALLLLSFAAARAAATGGYRLAGIVTVGKDCLGFLELPGGGQVLVRQGSTIEGGGRIVTLDDERLRIAFPDGTIELRLEGSGKPSAALTTQRILLSPSDQGHVMLQVDAAALDQALKASHPGDKHADAGVEVAHRFASLVDLPNNARVLAVNEVPVASADRAIRLAEKSLAEGSVVRLNLEAPGGDPDTRVYLLPAAR